MNKNSSNHQSIRVTLLTVGEYPTKNGLHASQVLPFAEYLAGKGIPCNWIAFYPIESWIRSLITKRFRLSEMIEFVSKRGVSLTLEPFPLTIARLHAYLFRDYLVKLAGRRLANILQPSERDELHIVHCRSYFATAVALAARNINRNIRVSFDMRSLLTPEVPLMFPRIGPALYGSLKNWEWYLLENCDYSFLQVKGGIALLAQEGHRRLPVFIPVAGFESNGDDTASVQLPSKPTFAYAGDIGPWQSAKILDEAFKAIAECLPASQFRVLSTARVTFSMPVQISTVPNHEVRKVVQDLWAMLVPGLEKTEGYFESMKLHANFFSTKAAEALSLGIPLIVNNRITELANYVRDHGCGLIFSFEEEKVRFQGVEPSELRDPGTWLRFRKSASRCSPTFDRNRIFKNYLEVWLESSNRKERPGNNYLEKYGKDLFPDY